jgi:hypothetical protein
MGQIMAASAPPVCFLYGAYYLDDHGARGLAIAFVIFAVASIWLAGSVFITAPLVVRLLCGNPHNIDERTCRQALVWLQRWPGPKPASISSVLSNLGLIRLYEGFFGAALQIKWIGYERVKTRAGYACAGSYLEAA